MTIRVLDLFCGAGGSSAGARLAGAQIAHAIDAWELAALTYKDNFPRAAVHTLTLTENTKPAGDLIRQQIDLICASPECTNHSPAKGAKPRCEDSKRTAHYVLSFAKAISPRWIVLENVVQVKNWDGYAELLGGLRALGYRISAQTLDAADFGVPQTRRRLFILCDRDRDPPVVTPKAIRRVPASEVVSLKGRWASQPLRRDGRAEATLQRAQRGIEAVGRRPFLIVYYGSDGSGGWQPLDRPLRTLTTLDRFGLVTWEGREPMLRMLQVEELRAAMGFPETYRFNHGSRRDRIKMIGNAVAPPVMTAIVEALVKAQRLNASRQNTRFVPA